MLDQIAAWADKYQALANVIGLLCGGPLIIYLINGLMRALRERDEAKTQNSGLNIALNSATQEGHEARSRLSALTSLFNDDQEEIWVRKPISTPPNLSKLHSSIPIMVIANLKGGVGKTTLAANLSAYFEHKRNERILAIDLDYQGSLSSMLLNQQAARQKRLATGVKHLLSGLSDGCKLITQSFQVRDTSRDSRLLECDSSFSSFEMRVLFDSIIKPDLADYRYNIANVLLSAEIQDQFDRIIIDAPPRITTGFIAALCAATHLVVPTVLDVLSAERVGLFLADIKRWQEAGLFGKFENNLFVVGTMKRNASDKHIMESEQLAIDEVKKQLRSKLGSDHYFLQQELIARKEDIAEVAGLRIAYFDNRSVFDPLGDRLFEGTPSARTNYESRTAQASFATL
jgi:cellulose biosynthesis protein BcsQ